MRFAFSTVSCPKWDFETIVARAKEYGYEGVEVRGFLNESILTASNPFLTDARKLRDLFDDNDLDNFINQKMLEASHFASNIYVNTGAKAALEFLSNLLVMGDAVKNTIPEVIFIDINMPMMDGFQFAEHFLQNLEHKLPPIKLVILTSSVFEHDRQRAREISPAIVFLNKPLSKTLLDSI